MIRAAVVGVGYLGTFHAQKYARSANCELVAVVDVNEKTSRKLAKKLGTTALTNYRDLKNLGVQCASVASDTRTHFEIAQWLLENGIDVLVEKPMATSTAEAKELIAIAAANRRILQVGHLERFNPAFQEMKRVLTRPHFFEARRIAPFAGRGHDVDVVLDLMIHDIDIISHLVGRPVERVEAVGVPVLTDNVDIANARITFEGGAVANVSASRAAFKSERTVRIFQPDVYISLDFGNKKLKVCTRVGPGKVGGLPEIKTEESKIQERDALEDEIESFLSCVSHRGVPVVSGEDGLRALELVDRIHQAFRESEARFDSAQLVAANSRQVVNQ